MIKKPKRNKKSVMTQYEKLTLLISIFTMLVTLISNIIIIYLMIRGG